MEATIRPATTDDDLEGWLAVRNAIEPQPMTLAGMRAERTSITSNMDLVASVDGHPIGAGAVAWGPISDESRSIFIQVWVRPEHRRRGTGGRLFDQLTAFARDGGIERLTTAVLQGDEASLRFAQARGLEIDGGGQLGRIDLTAPDAGGPVEAIDGVTVASLAQRPELEREVYELDVLVQPEIPFLAGEPLPSFEAWHAMAAGDPGFLHDLSLLALEGDRVIGAVLIYDNADATVFIGMTMVHPDARRRGIARHLKREVAHRARDAGIRRIETFNDGTNDRILALNEALGYVYDPPYVLLRGPVR